jgi:rhodanese-related sulfurtransferase
MTPSKITVDEVHTRMNQGEVLLFLDVRNPHAWDAANLKLPGALRVPVNEVEQHLHEIPRARTLVTYCTWPQDATSARVAQILSKQGYTDVHPLLGGFDAWRQAGYPVESKPTADVSSAATEDV